MIEALGLPAAGDISSSSTVDQPSKSNAVVATLKSSKKRKEPSKMPAPTPNIVATVESKKVGISASKKTFSKPTRTHTRFDDDSVSSTVAVTNNTSRAVTSGVVNNAKSVLPLEEFVKPSHTVPKPQYQHSTEMKQFVLQHSDRPVASARNEKSTNKSHNKNISVSDILSVPDIVASDAFTPRKQWHEQLLSGIVLNTDN